METQRQARFGNFFHARPIQAQINSQTHHARSKFSKKHQIKSEFCQEYLCPHDTPTQNHATANFPTTLHCNNQNLAPSPISTLKTTIKLRGAHQSKGKINGNNMHNKKKRLARRSAAISRRANPAHRHGTHRKFRPAAFSSRIFITPASCNLLGPGRANLANFILGRPLKPRPGPPPKKIPWTGMKCACQPHSSRPSPAPP